MGSHLSQELALLLSDSSLVPDCQLKHSLSELTSMDRRVHEGLVPPRFQWLLHCLCPPLTLITVKGGRYNYQPITENSPLLVLKDIRSSTVLLFKEPLSHKILVFDCFFTFYLAGNRSWRMGSGVGRHPEQEVLWLQERWQSVGGRLYHTIASPVEYPQHHH